jgi:hypothetical protein
VTVVRVRRLGDTSVVPIPRELEDKGYRAGSTVRVEAIEGGLKIVLIQTVHEQLHRIGRDVIGAHRMALSLLARHDAAPQPEEQ